MALEKRDGNVVLKVLGGREPTAAKLYNMEL